MLCASCIALLTCCNHLKGNNYLSFITSEVRLWKDENCSDTLLGEHVRVACTECLASLKLKYDFFFFTEISIYIWPGT